MHLLSAQLRNRPLKKLAVERKSDGGDVSGLFASEKVTCPAYFKVSKGKVIAASVTGMLPQRIKTLTGIGIDKSLLRQKEIGVSLTRTASDSSRRQRTSIYATPPERIRLLSSLSEENMVRKNICCSHT